ncbi:serine/threonine protein kinase [Marinilactibacillus piezotolerans]|uniref:non-specific serine/threonine protein kinase n=1 Tax=Marinilactibacillus piezotolerans TaxID=258723 RepID=A0A1I3VNL5_9LACT|nr:Stk1 family PASTA domain-containing Ser/Thr kinase [Marinilactibacillus piezotolerans]SFJ96573.1 serine/threonine protein kinase [Marinilactibacillus piezotolerans]
METGERINGRYKIIKCIGSGGMAKVYLARDLILERNVAVKLMAYNFHNDENSIRRFKREALATTELVHPNIVNIYDVGENENPYIVMEYVEGTDLKQYIHDYHPIPYKKSIEIMKQILAAVGYAHQHHIIHRDIKPQNILIDAHDNVKITDFGIAVALSQNSITQTNSLLGSVHYLSPEQARGSMATKQSDIYSLGILLYELLTGDVPFDGESAVSIALKHFQQELPSIRNINNRIPQPLENVVLKATAKESSQRYQTIAEMEEDLKTALSPERAGEAKFVPIDTTKEETRVIEPIAVTSGSLYSKDKPEESGEAGDQTKNKKDKSKPKKKKRRWLWVLLGIFLLILFVGGLLLFNRPKEVEVPDLEGLTQDEAEEELSSLNLVLGEVTEENDEEVEEGLVIRSDPSPGSTLREEASVDLFISSGSEPFEIENYENEVYEDIRAELTTLGFTVESEEQSSDTIAAGNIISQDIEAGEEVVPDETTITFTVSTGQEGFTLRDLSGYSEAGVTDYANDIGLSVSSTSEPNAEVPAGQVSSQSPEPGTTVYAGSRISVVFSTGPEEVELNTFDEGIIIPYAAPESSENDESNPDGEGQEPVPNLIQIFIGDAENNLDSVYKEYEITEDTPEILTFVVEEGESASYRVERDGEVILEESSLTE